MPHPVSPERREKIAKALALRQPDLTIVLDNIWNPHNVSAILRSCDAFGLPGVHLYYTTQAFPVAGMRASASAAKWVARERHEKAPDMLAALRGRGFTVLTTAFTEQAVPYTQWDFTRPTAIVFGSEHTGVSREIADNADGDIYIPMLGMLPSLNVSVATAVVLAEACRQRREAGLYDAPRLPREELDRLAAEWERG